MLKPTQEHIDAYVILLRERQQRLRVELRTKETAINRIERKLLNPEKALLADLKEGVKSVYEALGIPLPAPKENSAPKKKSEQVSGETPEINVKEPAPAAPKKSWLDDIS
jgi:hypothetical protein